MSGTLDSLAGPCTFRAIPNDIEPRWVTEVDSRLWAFFPTPSSIDSSSYGPGTLMVFNPKKAVSDPAYRMEWTATAQVEFGAITCGTIVPAQPQFVYLGHSYEIYFTFEASQVNYSASTAPGMSPSGTVKRSLCLRRKRSLSMASRQS